MRAFGRLLQAVQLVVKIVKPLVLLLLPLLPLLQLVVVLLLLRLATDAVLELLSSLLDIIQQRDVPLDTAHSGNKAVLHDSPHLCL